MAAFASSSLSATVAQAVSFLTSPLVASYPQEVIMKLRTLLEANLTASYAPTWDVHHPLQGSGPRCLTLSPRCLPPTVIYSACIATGVQWFDWVAVLGGREFDFLVDPGCVSIRYTTADGATKLVIVWTDGVSSPTQFVTGHMGKTVAQQLLEYDDEEEIFALIADEVHGNGWLAPPTNAAIPIRSSSPLSAISTHSRCSSRSSNSSGGLSLSSIDTSSPESSPKARPNQSRRERARQARVFVDSTKNEVTPYDGGKTTVLTGGVMLGGPKARKAL